MKPSSPSIITVLHLCEHFGGKEASLHGVARAFQWWIPLFDTSRFRVLLCSRKGPDKAFDEMKAGGLAPLSLGYGKMDPRNLSALMRLVRDERIDIIHAHGYGACMWARLAGRMLQVPVIVHGRCNYGTVPLIQRPIERILGPGTKYALAVSESTRQFTIQKRYIPADNVQVLYNGILMNRLPQATPEWIRDERNKLGVHENTCVIGVVGRLESHKGIDDLFRALSILKSDADANWQAWIIGDGAYETELKKLCHELKLDDRVKFTGFRRDAIKLIECFDIQVFPSHKEGTPNTLFEAMAKGCCAVASTADGQGELLRDNQNALLFEAGDVHALAAHLEYLIHHPEERARLSAQLRTEAPAYDGHRTVKTMENLYERMVQNR